MILYESYGKHLIYCMANSRENSTNANQTESILLSQTEADLTSGIEQFFHSMSQYEQDFFRLGMVATSLDLDGVVFNPSDYVNGAPYVNPKELAHIRRHNGRINRMFNGTGIEHLIIMNTNRESPLVRRVYSHIDPTFEQSVWGASMEAGSNIGMRLNLFEGVAAEQVLSCNGNSITFKDGTQATIAEEYDDGSLLIEASQLNAPHLSHIRLGAKNLSLAEIQQVLQETFQNKRADLGEDPVVPPGRKGMATVRGVAPELVVTNGEDLSDKKKWNVPDGSPIMRIVREAIHLNGEPLDSLPFTLKYYPAKEDRGLDVEFKGFGKKYGQRALMRWFRQFGIIPPEKHAIVFHIGDSPSDAIADTSEELGFTSYVFSVNNAEEQLVIKSQGKATYPTRKGVGQILYNTGTMVKTIRDAHTNQSNSAEVETIRPGSLADHVMSYLGREHPQEGDIDLLNVLENADKTELRRMKDLLLAVKERGGRVFLIGNGGSFESARVIAESLTQAGIHAKTPGNNKLYKQVEQNQGYSHIFVEALKDEGFTAKDMVIGISGSGNSPNVLSALEYAQQIGTGQAIAALGGRDGGKMKQLTGEGLIHLAKTECMEALEDEHPMIMAAVAASIKNGTSIEQELKRVQEIVREMRQPETMQRIIGFAEAIKNTIFKQGRIVVVGDPDLNPAISHAHADWGRGMINTLPISGPEVTMVDGNINAWMATGNDDGPRYGYADQMSKIRLGAQDVVVFMGTSHDKDKFEPCLEMAEEARAHTFVVGTTINGRRADVETDDKRLNYAGTGVVHTISRALYNHLTDMRPDGGQWEVTEIDTGSWPADYQQFVTTNMDGQRKLDKQHTLQLEGMLQEGNILPEGKVVVFCYGRIYFADDPKKFGLPRGFY